MALELLVEGVLALFFSYCIFYVQTGVPVSAPGQMGSAVWPTIILALLILCLVADMVGTWKKTPAEKRNLSSITDIKFQNILRSKLFWGILVLGAYSMALDYVGFLVGSFVFCMIFSYLLGQKNPVKLALFAFIAVVILYLLFYKGMGIMLPRGRGVFRSLGLSVEALLRNLF